MGQGLRVWDQNGNVIVDTNNRLPRVLGQIYANWIGDGDGGGDVYVPDFNQGNPWVLSIVDWSNVFYEDDTDNEKTINYAVPRIEGSNVKWQWIPRIDHKGYSYATWIIYGVY